jgi:lactoylglutathione lyase
MKIEHVAIWTRQLETLKAFYVRYFSAQANQKYTNPKTQFESYFLTYPSGARLEIMQAPEVSENSQPSTVRPVGYAHLAFSVGSKDEVDRLTDQLRADGYLVAGLPRATGDGYYESVILDPDSNRIEITI